VLYVNNNDTVLSSTEWNIHSGSRAFLYGDGVFESIRIKNGLPINLENHIKRLFQGAEAIKIRIPSHFTSDFFDVRIRELCKRSEIYLGGWCRLSIDRVDGGRFRPQANEAQFFIEVAPINDNEFVLNTKGWEIDIYTTLRKPHNFLSNFKLKNALLFVMASIEAQELQLDDVLICNTAGAIIESASSNLFVVAQGNLYTPSIEEGCLAGTMRMQVINLAIEYGMRVYESSISHKSLLDADEIFLTNAVAGIIWVSRYRTKRYSNTVSKRLLSLLNELH